MAISENNLREQNSEKVQELESQLKEKDRILKAYRKEHGKLEVFFNQVQDAITPIEPLGSVFKPQKKANHTFPACMQISDGHYGAVQSPEEIENFNNFNPDICEKRQMYFAKEVVNWTELMRNGYNIEDLHIIVTGDLISGIIHQELLVTDAMPAPVQAVNAGKLLARQIGIVSPHFKTVTVHFIVADNHSRLTKKPQSKEEGYNSFNYVVGKIAEAYTQRINNLEFNIYPMLEKVICVGSRQYLIAHGHNVRGWMGIPWYGIERHMGREGMTRMEIVMNEQNRMREIGFHKYIFGHYHTPFDHPHYSCSGSVSGTDAYDHKAGRHADPSQPAWLVNPKKGEFNRINFNLKHIV